MALLIPSLLTADPKDLEWKAQRLRNLTDLVQIDIMDNMFVPNISVTAKQVAKLDIPQKKEFHLMVQDPVSLSREFAKLKPYSIVFHIEPVAHEPEKVRELIAEIRGKGIKPGLAINPPTPVRVIEQFLRMIDIVIIMSVNPGHQGQSFIPEVLRKIADLKRLRPELIVEMDGGMSPDTARLAVAAGLDVVNSGSYIFKGGADDVDCRWKEMERISKSV